MVSKTPKNQGNFLQKLNVFDPYCGIPNNAAESVNHMIKSVHKHKELPLDLLCLHLFFLQKSIFTDITVYLIDSLKNNKSV